jgi:multiple sugar transport system ATP-binding protein
VVLRAGCIEQVGTPQVLYEKPANVFVAGFIGSPRMNFIPAATARTAASLQAAVPAGAQQVGIRPEHFQVCEAGQGLALRVLGTEYLGAQRLLQGQLVDGTRVELLIDGECSPQVGETLHITTRTDRLHAFDDHEQRLAQVNP